jgi:hypothetical protein
VLNTLRLMLRDPGKLLTAETARPICPRTGSKALLAGSIVSLGSEYVIGLRAINCETGDTLAQEQVQANRKEEVLKGLDSAASRMRRKLGESLTSIRKYDIHDKYLSRENTLLLGSLRRNLNAPIKTSRSATIDRMRFVSGWVNASA